MDTSSKTWLPHQSQFGLVGQAEVCCGGPGVLTPSESVEPCTGFQCCQVCWLSSKLLLQSFTGFLCSTCFSMSIFCVLWCSLTPLLLLVMTQIFIYSPVLSSAALPFPVLYKNTSTFLFSYCLVLHRAPLTHWAQLCQTQRVLFWHPPGLIAPFALYFSFDGLPSRPPLYIPTWKQTFRLPPGKKRNYFLLLSRACKAVVSLQTFRPTQYPRNKHEARFTANF